MSCNRPKERLNEVECFTPKRVPLPEAARADWGHFKAGFTLSRATTSTGPYRSRETVPREIAGTLKEPSYGCTIGGRMGLRLAKTCVASAIFDLRNPIVFIK